MIHTICTKSYKDAFDFAISSWLRNTSAKRIIVYTDAEWPSPDSRVEIVKAFEPGGSWTDNACRKPTMALKTLVENCTNIAFVDMDCYIRRDLAHVFDQQFDVAFTKLERKDNVSSGIYFYRRRRCVRHFMELWRKAIADVIERKEHECLSQRTLSRVIDEMAGKMEILGLDASVYNRKIKAIVRNPEQRRALANDDSAVLHFYGRSYQCKDAVTDVMNILGE
jgi:hypothetical protein